MRVSCRVWVRHQQVKAIVEDEEEGDHEAL